MSIAWGPIGESGAIDLADEEWSKFSTKLKNDAVVILDSCSTGKGGLGVDNMASKMYKWLGKYNPDIAIYAPMEDVSSVIYFENGLFDVKYYKDGKPSDKIKIGGKK